MCLLCHVRQCIVWALVCLACESIRFSGETRNLSRKNRMLSHFWLWSVTQRTRKAVLSNDAHGTWGLDCGEAWENLHVKAKCGDFVSVLEETMTITPDWKWEKHHLTSPVTSVAFLGADLIISGKKNTN